VQGVDKENLTSTSFGQARLEGTFSRKLSWSLSERHNRTSEQALYFLPRGPAKNHIRIVGGSLMQQPNGIEIRRDAVSACILDLALNIRCARL